MASTGFSLYDRGHASEKSLPRQTVIDESTANYYSSNESGDLKPVYDSTHRKLKPRHIQLIGIGG